MQYMDRGKADLSAAKRPSLKLEPPESVGAQNVEKTGRLQKTYISQNRKLWAVQFSSGGAIY